MLWYVESVCRADITNIFIRHHPLIMTYLAYLPFAACQRDLRSNIAFRLSCELVALAKHVIAFQQAAAHLRRWRLRRKTPWDQGAQKVEQNPQTEFDADGTDVYTAAPGLDLDNPRILYNYVMQLLAQSHLDSRSKLQSTSPTIF